MVPFCCGGLSWGDSFGFRVSLCGVGGWEPVLDFLRDSLGGVRFCEGGDLGGEVVVLEGWELGALAPAVASGVGGEGWESAILGSCWGVWCIVCSQGLEERVVILE